MEIIDMVKVNIISGFLGAGKTTLIKKLLQAPAEMKGEKIILLENEYGDVGVDGAFMKDSGIIVDELNSGCICCTLVGDFQKAVDELIEKYNPDRLIIEPSGVGKLSEIVNAVEKCKARHAELEIAGWVGFLFAILVGCVIAAVCGYLYAQLLNRLKGEEMSVTTYVGFSIVSLMCIAWLVLPFKSLKLRWPLGTGLRNTIGLDGSNFKQILNNFLSFSIGDFFVPTGLLLFMVLCCFLVWLFTRSKTGVAMSAAGNNPRFAEATGINVDKMRVIGTVLSTVLGAVGILVYSQSYGFMQLYTAPRQMGFVAASAILIGGASTSRCKISHVLIGTFLFQGVLTLGMPVANVLVPGSTISETLRILISNGIILYALTKSGGDSRA